MASEEKNNLTNHLDHGLYGDKQLNPDEQNKYLGVFKERVYFSMTVEQLKKNRLLEEWKLAIKKYPHATLLLNGNLPIDLLTPFLKLAHDNNYSVQLKNDARYKISNDNLAIVLSSTKAVDNPNQNIKSLNINDSKTENIGDCNNTSTKKSWWQKLFKGRS